jgi:hypothetical protein
MMSQPMVSTAASIRATRRRLMIGIVVAVLVLLAVVTVALARGGRPDPPALRAAATLLDGNWRFHTGDDPRWADPAADDAAWQAIDMTAPPGSHDGDVGLPDYVGGWAAHGHRGYHGCAWYRRAVTVPAGHAPWVILGPGIVEDGYELYWNGQLLGGSGRLGPHPRFVGTRPLLFALPADADGSRGVLAIRTCMLARASYSAAGGGMHSVPILAPEPTGKALHRAHWERTIAGYIVDAIEPIAMLALVGLALWCWRRSSHKGFLAFACIALALVAERRLNNAIVSWTDLESLKTYSWLARVMWVPTMAAWVLAWNRWCPRPWRSIDALAILFGIAGIIGVLAPAATLASVCRYGSLALFVVVAARIVRAGPMRILALATLAATMAELFGGELLDPIGVPGIWFPFGIGVSRTQYIHAIAIPLLAFLVVRTLAFRQGATTNEAAMLRQPGLP